MLYSHCLWFTNLIMTKEIQKTGQAWAFNKTLIAATVEYKLLKTVVTK
jgi:hypothetical protein